MIPLTDTRLNPEDRLLTTRTLFDTDTGHAERHEAVAS